MLRNEPCSKDAQCSSRAIASAADLGDLPVSQSGACADHDARFLLAQDRQVEDAAASAAAESDARALEEVRDREARLEAALAEAQASVANMRRLHQASQSQLFTMQASPRACAPWVMQLLVSSERI